MHVPTCTGNLWLLCEYSIWQAFPYVLNTTDGVAKGGCGS